MNKQHRKQQAKRMSEYRARADRARLELVVSPELAESFRQLPGLENCSNADKLQKLCKLWKNHHSSQLPVARKKALPVAGEPALDLDRIAAELDTFSQQLAEEDAADDKSQAPAEMGPAGHLLCAAAAALHKRRWHKRETPCPARWETIQQEPEVRAALVRTKAVSAELAELIQAGCLPLLPNEVRALGLLGDADFQKVISQLAVKGRVMPHQLGEIGLRFEDLVYQQPQRDSETWALV